MMENTQTKQTMLALFATLRDELNQLVASLTMDQKQFKGSMQQWGAKDMLAHLAFWGDHFNRQVKAARAGTHVPEAGDYYEILNDGVLLRNLERPFETVQREETAVYAQSLALLEEETDESLLDKEKYAYLKGRTMLDRALGTECWHVMDHISGFYLSQGQTERAERLQKSYATKLMAFPTWKANACYNLACFYSLHGKPDQAVEQLALAFAERPDLKEWSKEDHDIDPLRDKQGYLDLIDN
jgi:tetratricopeptide (TPR) repeat protein